MVELFISEWGRVREGLLTTIDAFEDGDLGYRAYDGAWPVGQLMLHIAHEERGEVQFGITRALDAWPDEYALAEYPTVEAIKTLLVEVHAQTETYLQTLGDADLSGVVETPWGATYTLAAMIWHVVEHEIHHRGELSLILGTLGRDGLNA